MEHLVTNVKPREYANEIKGNIKIESVKKYGERDAILEKLKEKENLKSELNQLRKNSREASLELGATRQTLADIEYSHLESHKRLEEARESCTILRSLAHKMRKQSLTNSEYNSILKQLSLGLDKPSEDETKSQLYYENFEDGAESTSERDLRSTLSKVVDHFNIMNVDWLCGEEEKEESADIAKDCLESLWKNNCATNVLETLIKTVEKKTKELREKSEALNSENDAKQLGFEVINDETGKSRVVDKRSKLSAQDHLKKQFVESRAKHVERFFDTERCVVDSLKFQKDLQDHLFPEIQNLCFEYVSKNKQMFTCSSDEYLTSLERFLLAEMDVIAWTKANEFLCKKLALLESELGLLNARKQSILAKGKQIKEFSNICARKQKFIRDVIRMNAKSSDRFRTTALKNEQFVKEKVEPELHNLLQNARDILESIPWQKSIPLFYETEMARLLLSEMEQTVNDKDGQCPQKP